MSCYGDLITILNLKTRFTSLKTWNILFIWSIKTQRSTFLNSGIWGKNMQTLLKSLSIFNFHPHHIILFSRQNVDFFSVCYRVIFHESCIFYQGLKIFKSIYLSSLHACSKDDKNKKNHITTSKSFTGPARRSICHDEWTSGCFQPSKFHWFWWLAMLLCTCMYDQQWVQICKSYFLFASWCTDVCAPGYVCVARLLNTCTSTLLFW